MITGQRVNVTVRDTTNMGTVVGYVLATALGDVGGVVTTARVVVELDGGRFYFASPETVEIIASPRETSERIVANGAPAATRQAAAPASRHAKPSKPICPTHRVSVASKRHAGWYCPHQDNGLFCDWEFVPADAEASIS